MRLRVRPYGRAGQVRTRIPVYVAAVNEGMARMAGAVADGVVAHPMATSRYIDEVMRPAIAEGAGARGARGDGRRGRGLGAGRDVRRRANRRARTRSARSPSTRPCAPTTGSWTCTGSREVAAQIRELWRSFDLAGMTALVTDEMLDEMAVAGDAGRMPGRALAAPGRERRAAAARRARSWRRTPAASRAYHDAIVETFGAERRAGGARLRPRR